MNFLKKSLLFLKIFTLPLTLFAVQKDQVIVSENIISPDIENFDCHSYSLIEVSPGVLCAAWKGGPGKGKSNIDIKQNVGIWLSSYKDGQWSRAEELVQSSNSVCWTPVLHKGVNGELVLFYRIDPRHTLSLLKRSFDGGLSCSPEEILPAGIIGPTKSKPLIDKEGNLICGSSVLRKISLKQLLAGLKSYPVNNGQNMAPLKSQINNSGVLNRLYFLPQMGY
jgi:hypothetical protein